MESRPLVISKDILFTWGIVAVLVFGTASGAAFATLTTYRLAILEEKVQPIPDIQKDVSFIRGQIERKSSVSSSQ